MTQRSMTAQGQRLRPIMPYNKKVSLKYIIVSLSILLLVSIFLPLRGQDGSFQPSRKQNLVKNAPFLHGVSLEERGTGIPLPHLGLLHKGRSPCVFRRHSPACMNLHPAGLPVRPIHPGAPSSGTMSCSCGKACSTPAGRALRAAGQRAGTSLHAHGNVPCRKTRRSSKGDSRKLQFTTPSMVIQEGPDAAMQLRKEPAYKLPDHENQAGNRAETALLDVILRKIPYFSDYLLIYSIIRTVY